MNVEGLLIRNANAKKVIVINLKHQNHSRIAKNEVAKLVVNQLRTEKSFDWSNANFLKSFISPLHVAYSGCAYY
ncbi:MAG: hypothetical protein ACOCQ4_00265 [bacterium]